MTVNVEIDSRITKCRKILDTDPNSQIFAALAEAYRKKGDLEKAFRVCQNGLRVHPDYGPAHVVMAKVNLDRGLYDWAEAEVCKARELGGNNRSIELLLAEIFIYKGEYKAAITLLKKLAEADPGNDHVHRLLEIAMKIPREQAEAVGYPVAEAAVPTQIDEGQTTQVPLGADEPPKVMREADLLSEALGVDHVQGALYINFEGLVIESAWQAEAEASVYGAAMAEVSKLLGQELMKASFGGVDSVLIETANLVLYQIHVDDGIYLTVSDPDVNLGTLRMKMAALTERVKTG
jgi:predicted regulator of Ras-like GTPase activity (Roadblock/LC7/MglB family)